jgi:hypothetical protein
MIAVRPIFCSMHLSLAFYPRRSCNEFLRVQGKSVPHQPLSALRRGVSNRHLLVAPVRPRSHRDFVPMRNCLNRIKEGKPSERMVRPAPRAYESSQPGGVDQGTLQNLIVPPAQMGYSAWQALLCCTVFVVRDPSTGNLDM